MLMNAGKTQLLNLIAGKNTDKVIRIALGTGNTAAAVSQTALVAQVLVSDCASTVDGVGYKVTFTAVFQSDGSTYREVGLFNADSSIMFFRKVLAVPQVFSAGALFLVNVEVAIS